ncbi:alpha/beta hydrolase family protein [Desulforhopalus sp. 52FAK]
MKEHAFRYGEHNQGLGVLTMPDDPVNAPVVVMLNSGLSYRAEPYRLNVLAGRLLAEIGYICLRVDLSGKGDTPARENISNRESVALDWQFIKKALQHEFGDRNFIIFGLCSGADNGIKIAAQDTSVKGLILLDAVSKRDKRFRRRDFFNKVTNISKWKDFHNILYRKIKTQLSSDDDPSAFPMSLRDEPTDIDMDNCFNNLVSLDGRILAVFTGQTLYHYNELGQFSRTMGVEGLEQITEEIFWPNAEHIYPVEVHREQLLQKIASWGNKHYYHLQKL